MNARTSLDEALTAQGASADLAAVLHARLRRWEAGLARGLASVYATDPTLLSRCFDLVVAAAMARPADLAVRDRTREIDLDWFGHESMVGYVTYVDRFTGTIDGIADHLDHLTDLGVTYLHLMPLLATRPVPNDGGYAVTDYRSVQPELGSMDDLAALAEKLHEHDISLCVDVVLNHTAAEHEWAVKARAGEQRYLDYYLTYEERTIPDAFDETLPEVFPDTAPGNFTFDEDLGRWVWTTFNPWQWDLDWSNGDVFVEMLDIMLNLAQVGVDALRLDAIPFLSKRLGTSCQNLAEVHLIAQALRGLLGVAVPAVALKGEAIVAPGDLVRYQGVGPRLTREFDLLYHNQLMVQGWSALASQDGRLATASLAAMEATPAHASWVTYVRCHDDIGWAIDDQVAASRGWDGRSHRRFLSGFYAGELPYSFAEGAHFQEDFVSGDRRTSGTTAAMAGLSLARRVGDEEAVDTAIARVLLLYALAASYGGMPLVYMGDEIGLDNDETYLGNPTQASDNRWMHRPMMSWDRAGRREDPLTVEGRLYAGLSRLFAARATLPTLRMGAEVRPLEHDNDRVLAFLRVHPSHGRFVGLANFSTEPQSVSGGQTQLTDLYLPVDALAPQMPLIEGPGPYNAASPGPAPRSRVTIPPLSMRWVTEPR